MTIRWHPISLWCLEATISGITCRVWMSADGSGWHAWHERELPPTSYLPKPQPPARIVFTTPRRAMRAARIDVERLIAMDEAIQRGMRRRRARGVRSS